MHQPVDGAHGVVADRIVALGGIADELARVRHKLTRDRGARVVGSDEGGERRRKADRIVLRDRLELWKPFQAGQPRFDEILWAGQAAALASQGHSAFTIAEGTRAERGALRFIRPS